MAGFTLGLVLAVIVNVITGLLSRKNGLRLLRWLLLYVFVYASFLLFEGGPVRAALMSVTGNYPTWLDYTVTIVASFLLIAFYMRAATIVVSKLDSLTQPSTLSNVQIPGNRTEPELSTLTGSDRFSLLVPFSPAIVNSPIPMSENLIDPHFEFYFQLYSLAYRPDKPADGSPAYKLRNFANQQESSKFVVRLIQFYVFERIDMLRRGMQGTKIVFGSGVTPINKNPIAFPQSEPYSFDQVEAFLNDNDFFGPRDKMLWKAQPMCFPTGTSVVFSEQNEPGKTFLAFITLERKDHFKIMFTIAELNATWDHLPTGFKTRTRQPMTRTYNLAITMKYVIQQGSDLEFKPEEYKAWAHALSAGLKDATGFD